MKTPNKNLLNTRFILKRIIFFILFLLLSFTSFAQQNVFKEMLNVSYSIPNIETISNPEIYVNALNNANMNNHRLKSARNTIQFEGGVKVVLYSAEESFSNGLTNINPNDFPLQIQDYIPPVFRLADNNYIIELKQTIHAKGHQH
jgi:hypothetical protein